MDIKILPRLPEGRLLRRIGKGSLFIRLLLMALVVAAMVRWEEIREIWPLPCGILLISIVSLISLRLCPIGTFERARAGSDFLAGWSKELPTIFLYGIGFLFGSVGGWTPFWIIVVNIWIVLGGFLRFREIVAEARKSRELPMS